MLNVNVGLRLLVLPRGRRHVARSLGGPEEPSGEIEAKGCGGAAGSEDAAGSAGARIDNPASQENRERDFEPIEILEDLPVKTKPNPLKPTSKQIEEHLARGHVPYPSWCEECVRASGQESPYNTADHSDDQLPVFNCDYGFLTSHEDNDDKITLFVLK